jgi:hypothetical protein
LHVNNSMRGIRNAVVCAVGIAWILILVSPKQRRTLARKLADARRFVSHRMVDEEARRNARAVDAWEAEGGATIASVSADGSNAGDRGGEARTR